MNLSGELIVEGSNPISCCFPSVYRLVAKMGKNFQVVLEF
jgi:hypothetical protein